MTLTIPGAGDDDLALVREALTVRAAAHRRAAEARAVQTRDAGSTAGIVAVRDSLADAARMDALAALAYVGGDEDASPPDPGPVPSDPVPEAPTP